MQRWIWLTSLTCSWLLVSACGDSDATTEASTDSDATAATTDATAGSSGSTAGTSDGSSGSSDSDSSDATTVGTTATTTATGPTDPSDPSDPTDPSGPTDPSDPTTDGTATTTDGEYTPGYLHTDGADIVDHQGNPVRLTGLNWFGFETDTFAPHGLWARPLPAVLDQIDNLGFNVLRVPISNQLLEDGVTPNGIDFGQNPGLMGMSGVELLDHFIAEAGARGLKVILDQHRPDAFAQSELWYTPQLSEDEWIADWEALTMRYLGDTTVIGADLHNEPHGPATWGTGDPGTDWRMAAEKAGDAILAINPEWLIIVEGIEQHNGNNYWWGGNLRGAAAAPVTLAVPNQLVYSPHEYPNSVYGQPWFNAPDYPQNLAGLWHDTWGYLAEDGVAPVLIGEFGTHYQDPKDLQWADALAQYILAHDLSFTFWCLNPNSGDTGGILLDDWQTVHDGKMAWLGPLLAPKLP
ncbi:MAG: glycoside hydrolase family 5 protein [Myxococcales bacterium]|nr:glycoside hydrolase family 5 protein [Myxococcales bacterium]